MPWISKSTGPRRRAERAAVAVHGAVLHLVVVALERRDRPASVELQDAHAEFLGCDCSHAGRKHLRWRARARAASRLLRERNRCETRTKSTNGRSRSRARHCGTAAACRARSETRAGSSPRRRPARDRESAPRTRAPRRGGSRAPGTAAAIARMCACALGRPVALTAQSAASSSSPSRTCASARLASIANCSGSNGLSWRE